MAGLRVRAHARSHRSPTCRGRGRRLWVGNQGHEVVLHQGRAQVAAVGTFFDDLAQAHPLLPVDAANDARVAQLA